jgi:beta-glucosidase
MKAALFYFGIIIVLVLQFNSFPQKIDISGRVLSKDNVPESGVIATLKSQNLFDTTGSDGIYHLYKDAGPVYMQPDNKKFLPVKFEGTNLFFSVRQPQQAVAIDIYNLFGKKLGNVLNEKLSEGNYSINTFGCCRAGFSSQLYIIRLQIDKEIFFHKTIYFNNSQNRKMLGKSTLRSMDLLFKRAQEIDTVSFSKDSQVITTVGVSNLIEVLPDLFIVQRDIYGNLKTCQDTIGKIQTVISGTGIPDSTPKIVNLWYNSLINGYSGFVYFVYSAGVQNYSLYIRVYNAYSVLIARSAILSFPSTAGNINLPDFSTCNAKPLVDAGNDTVVSIKDSIKLHPVAVDSFGGNIAKWEWSINGNGFVRTSRGDTVIIAPSIATTSYKCIVKVTDNDGNTAIDSMNVTVVLDVPIPNAGMDTTVSIKDTIKLHGTAAQKFGSITEWAWDIGNTGMFKVTSKGDTNIIAPSIENLNYLCVLRVTDDDGNAAKDTVKITVVQDAPVAFAGNDTMVSTNASVLLHGTASQRFGSIVKWEWNIGNAGFRQTSSSDTTITGLSANGMVNCILKVTDDDGNIGIDTVLLLVGVENMIDSILSLMTLDEKIGQMTIGHADANAATITNNMIGAVLYDVAVNTNVTSLNALHTAALNTRLKIPLLIMGDSPHGFANLNNTTGTFFPYNIGLGCTGDTALVRQAYTAIAEEAAAFGLKLSCAPKISPARNERWGRTYEAFGETPEINSYFAFAAVQGLQQGNPAKKTAVGSSVKEYAGDGGTTNGIDKGSTVGPDAVLRAIHLPPFETAVNAGVSVVQLSYNTWNGVKIATDSELITNTLKNMYKFDGVVIVNWEDIWNAGVVPAINAGGDLAMVSLTSSNFISTLKAAVLGGSVPQSRIDDAVRRILRLKYKLGLFSNPMIDPGLSVYIGSAGHRAIARQCVRKSLVLLKNQNNVLPLAKSSKIHIVGAWANDVGRQCGGFTLTYQGQSSATLPKGTTIKKAIENACTGTVTYSTDATGIPADADVVVVVVGEEPYAEGGGDRGINLNLNASHTALINDCVKSGKPIVCILISGRPMTITNEIQYCDAFVAAWLPGTEGGGIADVLFGDYNFTGKLSHTWPMSWEQIPINTGNMGDASGSGGAPLFEYGYGLTY